MEFTRQQSGAIAALYDRILRAIRDVDFSVELQMMEKTGVSLQQVDITLLVNRLAAEQEPSAADTDAAFLRSLRIDPNLNIDTEAR